MKSRLVHAHFDGEVNNISLQQPYDVYMEASAHARATGQTATIEPKESGSFSV